MPTALCHTDAVGDLDESGFEGGTQSQPGGLEMGRAAEVEKVPKESRGLGRAREGRGETREPGWHQDQVCRLS